MSDEEKEERLAVAWLQFRREAADRHTQKGNDFNKFLLDFPEFEQALMFAFQTGYCQGANEAFERKITP